MVQSPSVCLMVYHADMNIVQQQLLGKDAEVLGKELELAKLLRILEVFKERFYRLDGCVGIPGALGITFKLLCHCQLPFKDTCNVPLRPQKCFHE